ncbi:MAG: potassium transporter [endosymbiont of Galathealinum brachiosum]|uniref:Potassium transporter n=1 Tax=endosymbiont of Galathealinum brachiosum TaxID=2200906 RepID=A0A370DJI8_9GAMM|nr:MAG: potassium transporter [endosymbiont of Galathealinum brachiosum]
MHDALSDTIILLAISVVAVAFFRRIKLPAILAYLTVGICLGPHAANLVQSSDTLHFLAEVGIAFLLFSLGLEFSLNKLIANRRSVAGLGSAQVTLTLLIAGLSAWLLGSSRETAFVIGCVIALSSTAIVIKQLGEQLETDSRHGVTSISILLFQDIAVVPMLVIIPAIAGEHETPFLVELFYSFATGVGVTIVMLAIGRWLLRPLFHEVASAHSAELFTLTVLLIALLSAWATELAGLSMALGAFLAGMMLSETEFKHQIENDIRPFRDIFLGLFFITVGMMLDLNSLMEIIHWAILVAIAIIVGKTLLIVVLSKRIVGTSTGVALRTGVVLSQCGEFGFAIMALAVSFNLLPETESQILLTSIILTMIATPFLVKYNGLIAKKFTGSYIQSREELKNAISSDTSNMDKHVIICGFGRIGQNIAKILDAEGFKYFALDYNVELITHAAKAGYKVSFGDSTHREILKAAGIERAAILVICHDNVGSAEKTLRQAKAINDEVPILVRTKDDTYYEKLNEAGATEVIPESLESSLMMASHVLSILGIPVSKIVRRVQEMRNNKYATMREFFHSDEVDSLELPNDVRKRLSSYTLEQGAFAIGKTIHDLQLQSKGITLHKNRKDDSTVVPPNSDKELKQGDVLVLFGTPEDLEHIEGYLLNG